MEHGITLSTFKEIMGLHLGYTPDVVDQQFFKCPPNEAFTNIDFLRLEQIKRVVKDMKNQGYNTLQLTGNKAFFVNSLFRVLQEYRKPGAATSNQHGGQPNVNKPIAHTPYGNTSSYPPRPPAAPSLAVPNYTSTSTSYSPHSGNAYNTQSKPANAYIPRQTVPVGMHSNNYGAGTGRSLPQQVVPGSASKPAPPRHALPTQTMRTASASFTTTSQPQYNLSPQVPSTAFNPFAVCSNAEVGTKIAPASKPVKLADRNTILNSREKYEVFYKLSVISGVTKEEILREIQSCTESELNEDYILYRIISRKDPEAAKSIHVAPTSKAQEDAELDRAILESEKERDNIQDRKRQRTSSLKTDIQCAVLTAEEFNKSMILWGAHKSKPVEVKSSSSSSSKQMQSTSSSSSTAGSLPNNAEILNSLFGCTTIKLICLFFDHCGLDMDAIELIELVESDIAKIRSICVDIMLLEKDALKYYKDASYPYIISLCHTVDSVAPFRVALSTPLPNVKVHTKLNNTDYKHIEQHLRTHAAKIKEALSVELLKFQKGLYKIPKDGGLIPEIFRRKRLIPFINILSSQLDEDGFEVVNNYASLNLLSDVENEGLEVSEEEEDFSDDDY